MLLGTLQVIPGQLPPPIPLNHQDVGFFVSDTPTAAHRIAGGLRLSRSGTLELGSLQDRGSRPMRGRHRRHDESPWCDRHRVRFRKTTQHRRGHRHTAPQHPRQRHRRPAMTSHRLRQRTTDQRHPPVRPRVQGKQNQRQPIRRRTPPPPSLLHQQTSRSVALLTPTRSEQTLQEAQQRRQLGLRQTQGRAGVVSGLPQSLHPVLDTGRQTVVAPQHTRSDSINLTQNAEHFVVDGRLRHPEPTTQLPGRDLNTAPAVTGLRHQHEEAKTHHILAADEPRIGKQSADGRQQPEPHAAA